MYKQLTYDNGTIEWVISGELPHRINEPAVQWPDGAKDWYIVGSAHRLNGPAGEYVDMIGWYLNSKPHRINGPAIMQTNGPCSWYINCTKYSEADFNRIMKISAPQKNHENNF